MGPPAKQMRDSLLKWAVIWLVLGMIIPGINNAAHVGGLVAGLAFAYIPDGSIGTSGGVLRRARQSDATWAVVHWVCVAAWCATLFFMAKSIAHYWPELMSL